MSQQVQPVDVYPSPNVIQPRQHSSHSNGSFGPVFIVLGVIVALTIVAIVLSRMCNRRRRGNKAEQVHHADHGGGGGKKKAVGKSAAKPHDKFQTEGPDEGDIEFGFDKKIATSKVADHRDVPRGPKHASHNGESKAHVRFADIDFRAGP